MLKSKVFPFMPLIIAAVCLITAGCEEEPQFEEVIENVRLAHAPDARENVFDVKAEWLGRMKVRLKGEVDNSSLESVLVDSLHEAGFQVTSELDVLPVETPWPWALVNLSVSNIRSSPSHRSELVTQALMGNPVRVLRERGSWVYVQTPDRYLGWAEKSALTGYDQDDFDKWKHSARIIFTETFGYIRDKAEGNIISDITAGAILSINERSGNFIGVTLPDGRSGIVNGEAAACFEEWSAFALPTGDRILETALKMKGFPYLWGGTSPKGIDCSGFTRIVWFMNGMVIARDASLQARHGSPVDTSYPEELEAGDLLFFRTSADAPPDSPVTHVAIYKGNKEYIHAAGMVAVNSLDSTMDNYSAYRAKTLQSGRRIEPGTEGPGMVPVKEHPWYWHNN